MNIDKLDKRALREVAERATKGPWTLFSDIDTKTFSIHTPRDKRCENVIKWGGFDCQPNAEANAEFIAAFNPKVALALLDENIQLQREKDAIEAVALALRDDMRDAREQLEEAEKRNVELESKNGYLRTIAHEQNELAIRASLDSNNATVEMGRLHKRIAELEAREVNLSKLSVGEVMHMSGFSRDYADGWCAGNDNAIHEIRTAGIKVKES